MHSGRVLKILTLRWCASSLIAKLSSLLLDSTAIRNLGTSSLRMKSSEIFATNTQIGSYAPPQGQLYHCSFKTETLSRRRPQNIWSTRPPIGQSCDVRPIDVWYGSAPLASRQRLSCRYSSWQESWVWKRGMRVIMQAAPFSAPALICLPSPGPHPTWRLYRQFLLR
jgi:hypothetical protein